MADRGGDAFGRFYRENLRGLRGYVARLLPSAAVAEDVANEAFTRVLAASTTERPVPPTAYLYSTARNLALNHLRGVRVRGEVAGIEALGDVADPSPAIDREIIARERVRLLWDAVNRLPPRCRQVFIMRKVEQISNAEIAEKLGISVSAVEKHIRQGLRSCRDYLASVEAEEGCEADAAENVQEGAKHG